MRVLLIVALAILAFGTVNGTAADAECDRVAVGAYSCTIEPPGRVLPPFSATETQGGCSVSSNGTVICNS